ncbi:MAG: 6-bladed beta-propeller [Gemmatimonadales bacterium]|nr:6-bladed beta-propeller [Gemmatimonadales bacterium]
MRQRLMLAFAGWSLLACGGPDSGRAGDVTVSRETAGDTNVVTITGDVPDSAVRQLVAEMRIAPGADDVSLFTTVYEFDVDAAGQIWAFDQDAKTILRFDSTGALIQRIGREGAGPGEFRSNNGMVTRPGGGLAIWDGGNSRITFFDSTGAFVESWPVTARFSTNDGVTTDRSGAIYLRQPVTDPTDSDILGRLGLVRLRPGGAFGDSLVPPDLGVPVVSYVAQTEGGRASRPPKYGPRMQWAWHPDGGFVAAHGGNYDLQMTLPGSQPLAIRRRSSPVPVDPEELALEEEFITWAMRNNQPDWTWNGPPLPTTKAPVFGIQVARDGRIWTQVAVPSERIPDAELPPPPRGLESMPVQRHRMAQVHEVFTTSGEFLGRVAFPKNTRFIDADGDLVWALATDEDGLPQVVRFRVEPGFSR